MKLGASRACDAVYGNEPFPVPAVMGSILHLLAMREVETEDMGGVFLY
jgi:hypothetical protein